MTPERRKELQADLNKMRRWLEYRRKVNLMTPRLYTVERICDFADECMGGTIDIQRNQTPQS